jgi:arsenate reductase
MAEGWARALKADAIEAYSAGTDPGRLDARAVEVMGEAGVDISTHFSKSLADLHEVRFDVVITVCDAASESCPVFPGDSVVVHRGFDDPPRLARGAASEDEALQLYRRVRDEIRRFVETLPASLGAEGEGGVS